jgi:hypothetical protein
MWVRFTETVKHSGKDINLYFVQETAEPIGTSFQVYVKADENFTFKMYKNRENNWTINAENLPVWVFDIQPQLNTALQKTVNF